MIQTFSILALSEGRMHLKVATGKGLMFLKGAMQGIPCTSELTLQKDLQGGQGVGLGV